jgi:phosphoglycolate phosphatase-like HAD superfamily hydrolase
MSRALEELTGVRGALEGIAVAGRTDPWILSQVADAFGLAFDAGFAARFRARYLDLLAAEVEAPGPRKGVMPGVRPLLDALAARADVLLGLLTGNYEGGARVKLAHFGLWDYFRCGAYGDEAADRNALLATALDRARRCGAGRVGARDTVIVGDTPHDVAVAVAGGARSVAVATGSYSVEALKAAGADVALEDLSDLSRTLAALGVGLTQE